MTNPIGAVYIRDKAHYLAFAFRLEPILVNNPDISKVTQNNKLATFINNEPKFPLQVPNYLNLIFHFSF